MSLDQLENWVKTQKNAGYTKDVLYSTLINTGYPKQTVEAVLDEQFNNSFENQNQTQTPKKEKTPLNPKIKQILTLSILVLLIGAIIFGAIIYTKKGVESGKIDITKPKETNNINNINSNNNNNLQTNTNLDNQKENNSQTEQNQKQTMKYCEFLENKEVYVYKYQNNLNARLVVYGNEPKNVIYDGRFEYSKIDTETDWLIIQPTKEEAEIYEILFGDEVLKQSYNCKELELDITKFQNPIVQ